MTTNIQRGADIDFSVFRGRTFHPSPPDWADLVMYFLLVDRFSDGNEQGYTENTSSATPPYEAATDHSNAIQTEQEAAQWREAGGTWVGGTLKGLESKLGYLERLGITCLWISPVFRQVHGSTSYHGYAIQNFLDVDPAFGTPEELRSLVRKAHERGIYVILDIILNHAGDVFAYDCDRYREIDKRTNQTYMDPRWDGKPYRVEGFRDNTGKILKPFGPVDPSEWGEHWSEVAVWPMELQHPDTFTQKGRITNWDHFPELYEGDFFTLKDITLGLGSLDDYSPSPALKTLCAVYQYWLAYADLDGYRLDTVKHMEPGAVRFFARNIHEYAQTLGKENFYIIGEIAGGREHAFRTLESTGLDAALGIDDIPRRLEDMVKGAANPGDYFSLFRNSTLSEKDLHKWSVNKVVTIVDDHDQLLNGEKKARFCAYTDKAESLMLSALALNVATMGIPCIYYGSEQCFDGAGDSDRYIREAMLGGSFGAFRSRGRHFFNESHPVYAQLAAIIAIRQQHLALRRGRQYFREISGNGVDFGYPRIIDGPLRSIVAWSRVFDRDEMVLAINTDTGQALSAWVTVDASLNPPGTVFRHLYPKDAGMAGTVEPAAHGRAKLRISVPAAGFVILQRS